jgi:hypothetical protein
VAVAEVDPHHRAGARAERDERRRTPAAALVGLTPVAGLDDLTVSDESGDETGHRRAREARPPGEVRAAQRPLGFQQRENGAAVGSAQPLE